MGVHQCGDSCLVMTVEMQLRNQSCLCTGQSAADDVAVNWWGRLLSSFAGSSWSAAGVGLLQWCTIEERSPVMQWWCNGQSILVERIASLHHAISQLAILLRARARRNIRLLTMCGLTASHVLLFGTNYSFVTFGVPCVRIDASVHSSTVSCAVIRILCTWGDVGNRSRSLKVS